MSATMRPNSFQKCWVDAGSGDGFVVDEVVKESGDLEAPCVYAFRHVFASDCF